MSDFDISEYQYVSPNEVTGFTGVTASTEIGHSSDSNESRIDLSTKSSVKGEEPGSLLKPPEVCVVGNLKPLEVCVVVPQRDVYNVMSG